MAVLRRSLYLLIALLFAGVLTLATSAAAPAAGECYYVEHTWSVNGVLNTQLVKVCPAETSTGTYVTDGKTPPTTSGIDPLCASTAISNGVDPEVFCKPDDGTDQKVTPGLVAIAFASMAIPPAQVEIEPPNGRTLVNFDTNFFTVVSPVSQTFRLLGQQVVIDAVPTNYTWHFGDGKSIETSQPGAPYPTLEVTHRYLLTGSFAPSVDTVWSATYRLNGGDPAVVPGSLRVAGPPSSLRAVTATPTLVGYQ